MSTFNYFIEANAGIIVFYTIYQLLLARETDFRIQRLSLVSGLFISIALPLTTVALVAAPIYSQPLVGLLPEVVVTAARPLATTSWFQGWNIFSIGTAVYLAGMIVVVIPIAVQAKKLIDVYRKSAKTRQDGFCIVEPAEARSSFSFFRTIVIGQSSTLTEEEKNLVVLHEQSHGRLYHSLDVLFVTCITIVFWFNPLVWSYRRTLLRVHEYQVDNVVAKAYSSTTYSLLLAKTALVDSGLLLAHHFNKSFIMKRIQMISQFKNPTTGWKLATLFAVAMGYAVVVACTDQVSQSESGAFTTAKAPAEVIERLTELKTLYPGSTYQAVKVEGNLPSTAVEYLVASPEVGSWIILKDGPYLSLDAATTTVDTSASPLLGMGDFYNQIAMSLTYPKQARQMGIEGKVFVEFVVRADGQLTEYKVVKGIGAGCDASALAAITRIKKWKPATLNGKAVDQKMVLPITFKLG